MHTFLTGQVQIGKSTALRRFLAERSCRVGGFCTHWEGNMLFFRLLGAANEPLILARHKDEHTQVDPAAFDAAGRLLLAMDTPRYDLLCLDELGFMEACSPSFLQAVCFLLDGGVPAVGVLRSRTDGPFWEMLHMRSDTQIWTVTKDNRDRIPAQLLEQYHF